MNEQDSRADRQDPTEAPFAIEELFYSRTDKRGVILAGNEVFRRVSGYDWPQLLGAPHRMVRNPITPRAVFAILWSTIQKSEPAVAYVCNRAQDGRPYWVLATILPFRDGYLSVRIKPSSPLLAQVKSLYDQLSRQERAGELTLEASVETLLAALRSMGFADYQSFMRHALATETTARDQTRHHRDRLLHGDVEKIRRGLQEVVATQATLVDDFERLRILPTNMRILASRLEPSGGAVGAISDIYLSISADLFRKVGDFTLGEHSLCKHMSEQFEKAVFLTTCAQLQAQVIAQAQQENSSTAGFNPASEASCLAELGATYRSAAALALTEAEELAKRIDVASNDLRRSMLSLETITVIGKVESTRIGEEGERVAATIDQLHSHHLEISKLLGTIAHLSRTITAELVLMQDSFIEPRAKPQIHPPPPLTFAAQSSTVA